MLLGSWAMAGIPAQIVIDALFASIFGALSCFPLHGQGDFLYLL